MRDTEDVYDTHYLWHNPQLDNISFGDSPLMFDGNDIVVKDQHYHGTPGLYELIFIKSPNVVAPTKEDFDNFKAIMLATNAHKRHFRKDAQVAGNRSDKYRYVIKPMLQVMKHDIMETQAAHSKKLRVLPTETARMGRGISNSLMQQRQHYNNKKIDYVHWDDPNELVHRLKLLISSQIAGNDNHNNEINSIVEELKEANLIE